MYPSWIRKSQNALKQMKKKLSKMVHNARDVEYKYTNLFKAKMYHLISQNKSIKSNKM